MNHTAALERLKQGNQRFTEQLKQGSDPVPKKVQLQAEQNPMAIILGCSDARVPAELVFDQGLGDLFVIRVAGNIVAPSQIGSIEFAAATFGTPLVVVLGHSQCGAIAATLDQLTSDSTSTSPNLESIVSRIAPGISTLLEMPGSQDKATLTHYAVRANIRASVGQLRQGSRILEQLIGSGELTVVGAQYYIESGEVEFFE